MNNIPRYTVLSVLMLGLLSACASTMVTSDRQVELRNKLTTLQTDPVLSRYAPEARAEAEAAVNKVEQPQISTQVTFHNDFVAHRKIEIAEARAREAYLLEQQKAISASSADARLASRTAEADAANRRAAQLSAELAALNAKPSPRGMVITLGDVLFANGQSNLNPGTDSNLSKLFDFLINNPDRKLLIEGHTDSVGSAQSNMMLSQSRAQSVFGYLISRGISANRLSMQGLGESSPVSTNASAEGRQQNRRVEITVLN
jgi:outer membrane protein OmpA-like peptidoglycan-associated protein